MERVDQRETFICIFVDMKPVKRKKQDTTRFSPEQRAVLKELDKYLQDRRLRSDYDSDYMTNEEGMELVNMLPAAEVVYNRSAEAIAKRNKAAQNYLDMRQKVREDYYGLDHSNPERDSISDSLIEDILEYIDPSGITAHDDARRAYKEFQESGESLPTANQSLEMFSAIPLMGKFSKGAKGGREALQFLSKLMKGGKRVQKVEDVKDLSGHIPYRR